MRAAEPDELLKNKDYNLKLVIGGVILLTVIWLVVIFSDITNHKFLNWDDIIYIVNNPYLQRISLDNFAWMLTDYTMLNWHPITWLSHNVEIALYGKNPALMKATNVLLHSVSCIVLFFVSRNLLEIVNTPAKGVNTDAQKKINTYAALIASSIFAIHPQHIESIVWISERKDVLCNLFFLSAILCYIKYKQLDHKPFLGATIFFAALATMSKPMAVSLPVVLIMLDILVFRSVSREMNLIEQLRILIGNKLLLFVFSIFIAISTLHTQSGTIKDFETISLMGRIINAGTASLHYLGSLLIPYKLTPFYPFNQTALNPDYQSIFPVLAMLAIIVVCLVLWKKGIRIFLIAMAFYLVTILPVIGLVTVGHQAYADRYTYLPTSLFYIALIYPAVQWYVRNNTSRALKVILPVVVLGIYSSYGITSAEQVKTWRSDETLWSSVADRYPGQVFLAHQNLGNSYLINGQYLKAIHQYKIALTLDGDGKIAKTHENLGRAYAKTGDKKKEIEHYLLAIEHDNNAFWPHLLAAYFYLRHQDLASASKYIEKAGKISPHSSQVIIVSAKLNLLQQKPDIAKKNLKSLLSKNPENTEALWLLAQISYTEGNLARTQSLLENLLDISPDNRAARNLLAKLNTTGS